MKADSSAIADFLRRFLQDLPESYFVLLPTCERSKIPFPSSQGCFCRKVPAMQDTF